MIIKTHFTFEANNYVELNIDKCKNILFTCFKNPIIFNHKLSNNELIISSLIKDLGIHFELNLSFKLHYKTILYKSYKMLGFINENTQA